MYRRLISVKEAAGILNLSVITIYRMVKDGRIKARKLCSRVLIAPDAIGINEIPEQPESKPVIPPTRPVFEAILKDFVPELERAFKNVPAYVKVAIRVVFHNCQPQQIGYQSISLVW